MNEITGVCLSNRCGVALTGGANRNVIRDLRANANREHGFLLSGVGTRLNRLLQVQAGVPALGELEGNDGGGIRIEAGASDNRIERNADGGAWIRLNGGAGVRVLGAATDQNVLLGAVIDHAAAGRRQAAGVVVEMGARRTHIGGYSPEERNVISGHSTGVLVATGAAETTLFNNLPITGNLGPGIRLAAGGNLEVPTPVITGVSGQSASGTVAAPDFAFVELFRDPADEGQTNLGTATVFQGRFSVPVDLRPSEVGAVYQLHTTVTWPAGHTSEFGEAVATGCRPRLRLPATCWAVRLSFSKCPD